MRGSCVRVCVCVFPFYVIYYISPLSASPTKWLNILKQFVWIVWVCLTILWCRLQLLSTKSKIDYASFTDWMIFLQFNLIQAVSHKPEALRANKSSQNILSAWNRSKVWTNFIQYERVNEVCCKSHKNVDKCSFRAIIWHNKLCIGWA